MTFNLPLLLAGCVLAISGTTTIDAPVERVVIDASKGDVHVEGRLGDVTLQVDFGGLGSGEVGHRVRDGVLFVDYHCGGAELCGGDIELTVPPRTPVEIALGAGDVHVEDLRAEVVALVGAGAIELEFPAAPDLVQVVAAAGSIEIGLPAGAYALELDAVGAISVDPGIVDDADSPHVIVAEAGAGSIDLRVE